MMGMKAAILFSGGKDSTMAALKAMEQGWQVEYLVSIHSQNPHSYMFHVPNIHLTHLLSQAMGIPLIKAKTLGKKEEELRDLKQVLSEMKKRGVESFFTGAIASEYQKSRIDKICKELGLQSNAPLWHLDPLKYMEEIIKLGFKVIITSVSAEGLDESWLGRKIDQNLLKDLLKLHKKYGLHLAFEGGEAETLVLDGPLFKKRLNIIDSEKVWEGDSGYLVIKEASLEDKNLRTSKFYNL
jgi:diphthine-ammonia ligase